MTFPSVAQPLHTFKDGDAHVAATIEGDTFVIAQTRNEEHASEGKYGQLVTVINLADAVAMAKAILAAQEEAALDAHVEEMFQRRQDYAAMVDDALESEIRF